MSFNGPGFQAFTQSSSIAYSGSELFGKMESRGHSLERRATRGRGAWGVFSLTKPDGSGPYNASDLASKVGTFNADFSSALNLTDVPVDKYGFIVYSDSTQVDFKWLRDGSGNIEGGRMVQQGFGFRPLASYFYLDQFGDNYSMQVLRLSSNSPNYIVVRMQFDYVPVVPSIGFGNWRNFSLNDSGSLTPNDVLTVLSPDPSAELTDPIPTGTGWAYVPFFGMSWTDFQARYV